MIPSPFEYQAPTTVQEALGLLSKHEDDAKVLAGGHSLIPMMRLRLATPRVVIDLGRVAALKGIRAEGDSLVIGALTTHYLIESSTLLRGRCPVLCEAAAAIGDVQVRNKGTIGGSLAHADPAGDVPAAVLALDAELRAVGPGGERVLRAHDFFVGLMTTALRPDEILTEIRIPAPGARTGSAYLKLPQKASGFAIVGVAAVIALRSEGTCEQAVVGVTGVGATPYRARALEAVLAGRRPEPETLREAARKVADGVEAQGDLHASAEYRVEMAAVYARRALRLALERAQSAR